MVAVLATALFGRLTIVSAPGMTPSVPKGDCRFSSNMTMVTASMPIQMPASNLNLRAETAEMRENVVLMGIVSVSTDFDAI